MARERSRHRRALEDLTLTPASVRRIAAPELDTTTTALAPLIERLQHEFAEMPGLSLTTAQAARLLNVHEELCVVLLRHLVEMGVLRVRGDGRYVRRSAAA